MSLNPPAEPTAVTALEAANLAREVPPGAPTAAPVLLLPVRVETAFVRASSLGHPLAEYQLRVRVYPDQISINSYDPRLTAQERSDALGYASAAAAADPGAKLAAWRGLVQAHGAARAAYLASIAATVTPTWPTERASSWDQAAVIAALPDRWTVALYASAGLLGAYPFTNPVDSTAALAVGLDPKQPETGTAGMAWLVDFDQAVAAGMATTIQLTEAIWISGFTQLVVYGLRTSEQGAQALAELLDAHHYTDGLAFLPQGAPTRNTPGGASAYTAQDGPDGSFAVEQGAPLTANPVSDGAEAARLLGLPPAVFDHVAHADGTGGGNAAHMVQALWPATLGYFLTTILAGVFAPGQLADAQDYCATSLRPRGPLAALRVGNTAYGILPVTSLQLWQPTKTTTNAEEALVKFLRRALPIWKASSSAAPRLGRPGADPDAALAAVMAMDASSVSYRGRWALGRQFVANLLGFLDFGAAAERAWLDKAAEAGQLLLDTFGYHWTAPLFGLTFSPGSFPLTYPNVQAPPLSETAPLADDATSADGTPINYLQWLRAASLDELRQDAYPGTQPTPLLYRLIRQSILLNYFAATVADPAAAAAEPELVGFATIPAPSRWALLDLHIQQAGADRAVGGAAGEALAARPIMRPIAGPPGSSLPGLAQLAALPTAELNRLLTETLDVCSHRLDAWATSIATSRLQALRAKPAVQATPPLYVGGYGWAEILTPSTAAAADQGAAGQRGAAPLGQAADAVGAPAPAGPPATSSGGGFVVAPSLPQATTAAVLRSGYLSHLRTSDSPLLTLDLCSHRVRRARWFMDQVRSGQPLADLAGYQFEHDLHEAGLDQYLEAFRSAYQMTDRQVVTADPALQVAPSGVANGLAVHQAWQQGAFPATGAWTTINDPPGPGADRNAIIAVLADLDDIFNALAEIGIAEAVHQITNGNPARAGGSLDGISRGGQLPEPQVLTTPPAGSYFTHRVLVLLAQPPVPGAGWPDGPDGPAPVYTRADAEPALTGWVSQLLPDPATVAATAGYTDAAGHAVTRTVTLDQLDLGPLDFVALAQLACDDAPAGELARRIFYYAPLPAGATNPTLTYRPDPQASPDQVAMADAITVARTIGELIAAARPLEPADLVLPGTSSPLTTSPADDLTARAAAAAAALTAAADVLTPPPAPPPGSTDPFPPDDQVRAALIQASRLGVTGALPGSPAETGADLQTRASTAGAELGRRLGQIPGPVTDANAAAAIAAAFGGDRFVCPPFQFADPSAVTAAFNPALLDGHPHAPGLWLQQLTHIRPALASFDLARTTSQLLTGAPPAPLTVGQLPAQPADQPGARWLGLPLSRPADAGQPSLPPPGQVSLAAVITGDLTKAGPWSGLLIDEWPERIPSATHTAGLAFNYDAPTARAPNCLLLAVCPDTRPTWDDEALQAILTETLDLAKVRAVDLTTLDQMGQALPALYFPYNPDNDTISADIANVTQAVNHLWHR